MKQFTYTITNPVGIHARPAGLLVKAAKACGSTVTVIRTDGRSAPASGLIALMTLCVKCGETVTVTVEGGDEDTAAAAMERFFQECL